MKKTIVIIILAVYIASIAIVNFFGLEIKIFDGVTYVSSIQCDTVTFLGAGGAELQPTSYVGTNSDIPLFVFDFIPAAEDAPYTTEDESLVTNPNVIQLNYEILPHLATDKGVKYEYDESAGVAVFHELSHSFIFLKPGKIVTITIRATDGSNAQSKVSIMARTPA